MSGLTIDQKKVLWSLRNVDPSSKIAPYLIQPSHLFLSNLPLSRILQKAETAMGSLNVAEAPALTRCAYVDPLVVLAEIWGYLGRQSSIPDMYKARVTYVKIVCAFLFTAIYYSETLISERSSILKPLYQKYPRVATNIEYVLARLTLLQATPGNLWDEVVYECGEELIRVFTITFGADETTRQLHKNALGIKTAQSCVPLLVMASPQINLYS
jgi:hypothetical protein